MRVIKAVTLVLALLVGCEFVSGKDSNDELKDAKFYSIDGAALNMPGARAVLIMPDSEGKITSVLDVGNDKPTFDLAEFQHRLRVAYKVAEYDRIAWVTSDLAMGLAKSEGTDGMSADWFVYRDKSGLIAVYGRYDSENDKYVTKFAFRQKGNAMERLDEKTLKVPKDYARAVHNLSTRAVKIIEGGLRVNWYIFKNDDGRFSGYILPASPETSTKVYSKEWVMQMSKDGRKVEIDVDFTKTLIQEVKTGKDVSALIKEDSSENPSIAALFHLMRDFKQFKFLAIDNLTYRTMISDGGGVRAMMRVRKVADEKSP